MCLAHFAPLEREDWGAWGLINIRSLRDLVNFLRRTKRLCSCDRRGLIVISFHKPASQFSSR